MSRLRPVAVLAACVVLLCIAAPGTAQQSGLVVGDSRDGPAGYPWDGPNHITLSQSIKASVRGVELVDPTEANRAYPVQINGRWGLMNRRGQLVVLPRFDWIDRPTDALARFVSNGRTGYINVLGKQQFDRRFPWADRFAEGYAAVGDGRGKFGYIDLRGELIVPVKLDGALRFREGYAGVRIGQRCGFINARGDAAIRPEWAAVRPFHEGLAAVRAFDAQTGQPGRWAYIQPDGGIEFRDNSGRIEQLGDFNGGFARALVRVEVDGRPTLRWGYLNREFKWLIEPRYVDARDFHDGVAAVSVRVPVNDGSDEHVVKWGLINAKGDFTVRPVLDAVDDLDETLALIRYEGWLGYINVNGSAGIRPMFQCALPFDDELARVDPVGLDVSGHAWIDTSGRVIWDPRRPHIGILDATTKGQVRARTDRNHPGSRRIPLPRQRDPLPRPYPPEFLYEEQLPTPEVVSPFQGQWR